ncbi:hypothetical protein FDECE_17419 [Fusarium decemcellulare]|nr:hypothetical protein FDECE_17419 [Fusarium decemcellulare]
MGSFRSISWPFVWEFTVVLNLSRIGVAQNQYNRKGAIVGRATASYRMDLDFNNEAYERGDPIDPPLIEFRGEDEEYDEDYWQWHIESQQFRHWDELDRKWVSFPENFN